MGLSKKSQVIGIDIGSHSIKLVQLLKKKKTFELMNIGVLPLPEDTFVDGMTENPNLVSEVIKNLLSSEKIKTKYAVTSVSGESVVIKKISIPKMSEDELAESIEMEAEQYIPFDINDVRIDFSVLASAEQKPEDETGEDEGEQMEVLLVAAKKDIVEQRESILLNAGLQLAVFDLDVFATENSYNINYDVEEDKVISIVNIGASLTNINIIEAGHTAFTRDILMGGDKYTRLIQKQFKIEYEEAEKMKLGVGVSEESKKGIIQVISDITNTLASEIQKSIEFYSTAANRNIDKIYLGGGSARISGINHLLGKKLGINVEILDPLKNISITKKKFDPEYITDIGPQIAVAVGLAFRRFDDD